MKQNLFCSKCGAELTIGAKFCAKCGTKVLETTEGNISSKVDVDIVEEHREVVCPNFTIKGKEMKGTKAIAITNVVLGALMVLLSSTEYEWGIAPWFLGIGICVAGILQLLQKSQKVISIIQIVAGSFSGICSIEMEWDWELIGFVAGVGLLVIGIMGLLKKSKKAISIVEIVFGGVTLLLGFGCIEYAWGDTGIFTGAAFLVEGIITCVNSKKQSN